MKRISLYIVGYPGEGNAVYGKSEGNKNNPEKWVLPLKLKTATNKLKQFEKGAVIYKLVRLKQYKKRGER